MCVRVFVMYIGSSLIYACVGVIYVCQGDQERISDLLQLQKVVKYHVSAGN